MNTLLFSMMFQLVGGEVNFYLVSLVVMPLSAAYHIYRLYRKETEV